MQEKASRQQMRKMNKQEFAYNRPLLKEINGKLKEVRDGDAASEHHNM